jgi:hypothetical protein
LHNSLDIVLILQKLMKRLLAIIIATSYLCLSIGITVHIHYCMGRIVGASFVEHEEDHYCSHCGMNKTASKNGCCKDEHKIFKSSDDQLVAKMLFVKAGFGEFVPAAPIAFQQEGQLYSFYTNPAALANAPPGRVSDCPIYIRLRNFRV